MPLRLSVENVTLIDHPFEDSVDEVEDLPLADGGIVIAGV
jgi:hypothetical protein